MSFVVDHPISRLRWVDAGTGNVPIVKKRLILKLTRCYCKLKDWATQFIIERMNISCKCFARSKDTRELLIAYFKLNSFHTQVGDGVNHNLNFVT